MVTGTGAGPQEGSAMAAVAHNKKSARFPGRFLSDRSEPGVLEVDEQITDRDRTGSQRQLGQRRLFPENRYHELLLHSAFRFPPGSSRAI